VTYYTTNNNDHIIVVHDIHVAKDNGKAWYNSPDVLGIIGMFRHVEVKGFVLCDNDVGDIDDLSDCFDHLKAVREQLDKTMYLTFVKLGKYWAVDTCRTRHSDEWNWFSW
jgi:hypothetical protein